MEFQISEEAHQRILQSFEKGAAQPKRWGHALHKACMGWAEQWTPPAAAVAYIEAHRIACFCLHGFVYRCGSPSHFVRSLGHCRGALPGMPAKQVCLALLPAVLGHRRRQRSLRRTMCHRPPKAGRAPKPSPSPPSLGRLLRVLLGEGPRPKAEAKHPRNARHVDGCMRLYSRTTHFQLAPRT